MDSPEMSTRWIRWGIPIAAAAALAIAWTQHRSSFASPPEPKPPPPWYAVRPEVAFDSPRHGNALDAIDAAINGASIDWLRRNRYFVSVDTRKDSFVTKKLQSAVLHASGPDGASLNIVYRLADEEFGVLWEMRAASYQAPTSAELAACGVSLETTRDQILGRLPTPLNYMYSKATGGVVATWHLADRPGKQMTMSWRWKTHRVDYPPTVQNIELP